MNCQKFMKFVSHNIILLSLLFVVFSLLSSILVVLWVSPSVPSVDIDARQKRTIPTCKERLCLYQWANTDKALIHLPEKCPNYTRNNLIIETLKIYQKKKVDWQFLAGVYGYYWYKDCHRSCGIDGPFLYLKYFYSHVIQYPKALVQEELCTKPCHTKLCCRWKGYSSIFKIYFSSFSIPVTVFLTYINLTTLLQLLGKGAGAALYLHAAETVSDCILNIIVGFRGLFLFLAIGDWLKYCGYLQYSSLFQFMGTMKSFFNFLNQAYLVGLVADRLYALSKPYQYNNMSDLKRKLHARRIIVAVLLASISLYWPFILLYTFKPTFDFWASSSSFLKANINQFDFFLSTTYISMGVAMLITQIICGILVEKKFHKFIQNKMEMNQESEEELKKRELDKKLLLGGTIGLNVVTGLVNTVFSMVQNNSFYKVLGFNSQYGWWSFAFLMGDPVLTFVNGNGALIIHLIFVQSYRNAFKRTWFGRLMFTHQAQPT